MNIAKRQYFEATMPSVGTFNQHCQALVFSVNNTKYRYFQSIDHVPTVSMNSVYMNNILSENYNTFTTSALIKLF
jgi:hypothetical protein